MELELWDEMQALERRVDGLFRTFLGPRVHPIFPILSTTLHGPFIPAADVFSRRGDLVVRLELPGIDPKKDVQIIVQEGKLVVRGERRKVQEIKDEAYYRMETSYGSFERHIPVPQSVDEKKVVAEYKDGVLEIVLPAVAKAIQSPKAKLIPIKSAA